MEHSKKFSCHHPHLNMALKFEVVCRLLESILPAPMIRNFLQETSRQGCVFEIWPHVRSFYARLCWPDIHGGSKMTQRCLIIFNVWRHVNWMFTLVAGGTFGGYKRLFGSRICQEICRRLFFRAITTFTLCNVIFAWSPLLLNTQNTPKRLALSCLLLK